MTEHGYLYELLRKLGFSESQAETAELLGRPMKIVLLIVAAVVISRLLSRAARRFVTALHARSPLRRASPRAAQRVATVGDVLAGLVTAVVWSVIALLVLGEVGVNLGPLIAGAGIAGIAVGFGAQSLVKDFLSGFFILLEDQYGVGDLINLGEARGTVEDISLRVTRLRAVDGTVWFVPNGEITRVGNSSMEWSRALIDVLVAYDSDVPAVNRMIEEEARQFAADPAWAEFVLDPPEVWGVQAVSADGLTVRLVVKTAPRRHDAVARELRGRISERLRREGVKGPGQTVLVTAGALDTGMGPAPPSPPPAAG